MITVPQAVEKIIKRSRYLTEAMSKGFINYSSLARYIKPELEEMLTKKVSEAAILMALRRLEKQLHPHANLKNIFSTPPDMLVRSNLIELSIANSDDLMKKYAKLYETYNKQNNYFLTITEGLVETTIIASKDLKEQILQVLEGEKILSQFDSLASLTIRLPREAIYTSGSVFYFFLKSLAWEGINVMEVVSTYLEFTIILEEKDINRAFAILKSLFEK